MADVQSNYMGLVLILSIILRANLVLFASFHIIGIPAVPAEGQDTGFWGWGAKAY